MAVHERQWTYVPLIDKKACDGCGLCAAVCPGHALDSQSLNREIFGREPEDVVLGNSLDCYLGHATDSVTRHDSTSGGVVTALLSFALERGIIDGALVTKMREDKPLEPLPFIARTRSEVMSASRSKYCPVPANVAVKHLLKDEGRFAVVGLPCHIHGIRKAEAVSKKVQARIVLRLGLFCNHTPSFLATRYALRLAGVKPDEVSELHYRGDGWPGRMTIRLRTGRVLFLAHPDYWSKGFGHLFCPRRCLLCWDHANELADISFGDPWGMEGDHGSGDSVLVARSSFSNDLLRQASPDHIDIQRIGRDRLRGIGLRRGTAAQLAINRASWRAVPLYTKDLPKTTAMGLFRAALRRLQMHLGSHRELWPVLEPVISSVRSLRK